VILAPAGAHNVVIWLVSVLTRSEEAASMHIGGTVTAAVVRDGGVVAAVQADGREKGAAAAIMMGL